MRERSTSFDCSVQLFPLEFLVLLCLLRLLLTILRYGSNGDCWKNNHMDQIITCHGYTAVLFFFVFSLQVLSKHVVKSNPIA